MIERLAKINKFLDNVWPQETEKKDSPPDWQLFLLTLFAGLVLGYLIQDAPLLGYDWYYLFQRTEPTNIYFPPWIYPPWTDIILAPLANLQWRLGLALINGISITTLTLMTYKQGGKNKHWRLLATFMALFSLQSVVVLWLGHIDGIALLSLWALPWALPMLLMKSTFIGVAVFTRKSWFIAASAFGVFSLIIWPGWPAQLISTLDFRTGHPSAGGWRQTGYLPVIVGAFLFLKSKRTDLYQAMAAGAILYPFILPYHHIVLLPALGKLRGLRLLIAWLAAWMMLAPVILQDQFWIYFVFPLVIWLFRYSEQEKDQDWFALIKSYLPTRVNKTG
jgi:hypothetical protein